jgi:hypothetical protein
MKTINIRDNLTLNIISQKIDNPTNKEEQELNKYLEYETNLTPVLWNWKWGNTDKDKYSHLITKDDCTFDVLVLFGGLKNLLNPLNKITQNPLESLSYINKIREIDGDSYLVKSLIDSLTSLPNTTKEKPPVIPFTYEIIPLPNQTWIYILKIPYKDKEYLFEVIWINWDGEIIVNYPVGISLFKDKGLLVKTITTPFSKLNKMITGKTCPPYTTIKTLLNEINNPLIVRLVDSYINSLPIKRYV